MEVKIQKNNDTNYNSNCKNTTQKNGISFSEALNSVVIDSKNTQLLNNNNDKLNFSEDVLNGKTGIPTIDILPAKNKACVLKSMKKLYDIFGLNPYDYLKDDSTLDIKRMIHDFGDGKIPSYNLDALNKAINTLHDNGLIDDENYFYAVKWMAEKAEAVKIKAQSEKKINACFESIGKHKVNSK